MKTKILCAALMFFFGLTLCNEQGAKAFAEEGNAKTFKKLKEKVTNPKTGLPKTLDPNLFRGRAKRAYQVAKEIPQILAQMPCFCECEAFGHQNLLDCFVDNHGAW